MRLISAGILAICLVGCVPKTVYEDLQEELNVTRRVLDAQNNEIEAQIAAQDEALRQAEASLEESEAAKVELEKEMVQLNERMAQLTQEKAELLKDQSAFDESVEELQQAIAEAERAMVLEARVYEREATIKELRTKVQESQAKSDTLQRQVEQKSRQIELLNVEKSSLVSDRTELQSNVQEMTQALTELSQRQAEAEARLDEYQQLIARFQPLIDSGKLRVKISDGRMIVELPTDVLFASGSASLSKDGTASLKEVATILGSIPDKDFQVEGHTDNVPISTSKYPSNWHLAAARSITVVQTLNAGGLAPERVSAAAYGEFRPMGENDTKEGKAANRRIEIVVMPDLSSLPGYEELEKMMDEADAKESEAEETEAEGAEAAETM